MPSRRYLIKDPMYESAGEGLVIVRKAASTRALKGGQLKGVWMDFDLLSVCTSCICVARWEMDQKKA